MLSQSVLVLTCMLLLLTLCPDVLSRRGGFGGAGGRLGGSGRAKGGWGWGSTGAHRGAGLGGGHHVHSGSPSSGSNAGKIAGAAAAGALGGMVIGHGLSSMSRPGYGYGHAWHGGPGYGDGHGHPRYTGRHGNGNIHHDHKDFRNETEMEYYTGAATRGHSYSCVLLFSATMSFLIGYWVS